MTNLELISRGLIEKVKETQDSSALSQLIDLHTGVYVSVVNQYASRSDMRSKVDVQDVIDDKAYNIYQFALRFDTSKGMTFGSYVGDRTKNLCQNIVYRGAQSVEFNEEIAPSNDTSVIDTAEKDSSIETILAQVKGSDSEAFKEIFKLRYCGQRPKSWRQIAPLVGMSYEGCRKLYNKHIGAVREHLKT